MKKKADKNDIYQCVENQGYQSKQAGIYHVRGGKVCTNLIRIGIPRCVYPIKPSLNYLPVRRLFLIHTVLLYVVPIFPVTVVVNKKGQPYGS